MRLRGSQPIVAMLVGLGFACLSGVVHAEDIAAESRQSGSGARLISFESLGERYPIMLRGVDAGRNVPFSVRSDEVVSGAKVNLNYSYSPALLEELSQLNLILNDETVATLDLPRAEAGRNVSVSMELPTHLMAVFNQLKFQFMGHYTMECEDPLHSSLWVSISKNSSLELVTTPLLLPDELALLPVPFFDPRDNRMLTLPVVLDAKPDDQTLAAAGILASWFGAQADYRGARFPVTLGTLPEQGQAVVIQQGEAAQRWLSHPLQGPTLAVVTHPADPAAKLLLVLGRDGAETREAAAVLAAGSVALNGAVADVGGLSVLTPRQPYDAPRWLATDKPVRLGDLSAEGPLSVSGYDPGVIRLNLRLPPDLFAWHGQDVPLNLKYLYTPQPMSLNSSLLVGANDEYLRSYPLVAQNHPRYDELVQGARDSDGDAAQLVNMNVPLALLAGRGQLQFRFMYDYIKEGACRDIIVDNVRGRIDPASTLDFSSFAHYKAMPDLAAFASSGWPFTRMADLADTVVVLDEDAGPGALSAYLEIMGRFGESTGLPVLSLQVSRVLDAAVQDKDLLVMTAVPGRVRALWGDAAPAGYDADQRRYFKASDMLYRSETKAGVVSSDDAGVMAHSEVAFASDGSSAVVAGFESPFVPQRSVVLMAGADEAGLQDAARAVRKAGMKAGMPWLRRESEAAGNASELAGSLAVVRGDKVDVLVAEHSYTMGELTLAQRWRWWRLHHGPQWSWDYLNVFLVLVGVFALLAGAARLIFGSKGRMLPAWCGLFGRKKDKK